MLLHLTVSNDHCTSVRATPCDWLHNILSNVTKICPSLAALHSNSSSLRRLQQSSCSSSC